MNAQEAEKNKRWVEKHVKFTSWQGLQGKGHCPFHDDRNPSFSFNAEAGTWICHAGCGSGGIKALAERLKVDSPLIHNQINQVDFREKETIYPYIDENGKLLFEVVRTQKQGQEKRIWQRRPDNKGGYIRNVQGVRRILYKLPELLQAQKNGIEQVFIVEGEKCVEVLTEKGLTATCNPGGAGKWRDEYGEYFQDNTEAIIIPDADKPGMAHACQVAESLSGRGFRVKIIDLDYSVIENQGDDIYDWIERDGHTVEELADIINRTDYYEPGQNRGNKEIDPEKLEFPLEAMPDAVIPLIETASKSLGTAPDLIAVPLLTILGAAIGNNVQIEIHPGWLEKPNLFTAVVSPPGARKTPALKIAMNPLRLKQEMDREEYDRQVKESENLHREWKARKEQAKKQKQDFNELEPERFYKKNKPLYFITDATTEALTACLELNRRGFVIIHDELTALITSMNQYKGGKGSDRQWILQAWSSSPISLVRKGREAGNGLECINVPDSCISITGGIQPSELTKIIGDKAGETSDGFAPRFLIAYPDFCPAFYADTDGIPPKMEREYQEFYERVFEFGREPKILRITKKAKNLWTECHNLIISETLEGKLLKVEEETWHKMISQFSRITLIIHVCRIVSGEGITKDIDEKSIMKAWTLIDYFKANIKKVYREASGFQAENKIQKVIEILKKSKNNTATIRDIQRANKNLGDSRSIRILLNQMMKSEIISEIQLKRTTAYTLTAKFIESGNY